MDWDGGRGESNIMSDLHPFRKADFLPDSPGTVVGHSQQPQPPTARIHHRDSLTKVELSPSSSSSTPAPDSSKRPDHPLQSSNPSSSFFPSSSIKQISDPPLKHETVSNVPADQRAPSPATSLSAAGSPIPNPPRPRSATTNRPSAAPLIDDQDENDLGSMSAPEDESSPSGHASPSPSSTATTGKRKRSRVTPEQLAYLERIFAMDRSPGAAKRKEISESLGMQERQTQIWFQNRRAKAKLLESRHRATGGARVTHASPLSPPALGMASDAELQDIIHAGEPVTIIQCSDLTIGTWHRIASKTGPHDLIAYTAEQSQTLTWYIFSEGFGFRMDLPWCNIKEVDLSTSHLPPGSAMATITLTQAPKFYMEAIIHGTKRIWKECHDWTEGMQASTMLRHEVIGSATHLYNALSKFPGHQSPAPSPPPGDVVLRAPHSYQQFASASAAYSDSPGSSQPSPISNQASPLSLLPSPSTASPSHFGFSLPRDALGTHSRQRSYSGPPAYSDEAMGLESPTTGYPQTSSPFSAYSPAGDTTSLDYGMSSTAPYPDQTFGGYTIPPPLSLSAPSAPQQPQHQHSASLSDFSALSVPQLAAPSYPAAPPPQLSLDTSMFMGQHQGDIMSSLAGTPTGQGYTSFGEGGDVLLQHQHQMTPIEHIPTPPHPPIRRNSSMEPTSSLSGALGPSIDYSSLQSPHHPGASDYYHS